jgi:hypothetical protein
MGISITADGNQYRAGITPDDKENLSRNAELIVSVKPLKGFKQPNSLDLTLRTALPTVKLNNGSCGSPREDREHGLECNGPSTLPPMKSLEGEARILDKWEV